MSPAYYNRYPKYVSAAKRRAKAEALAKKIEKKGQKLHPVKIEGRTIARSTWGKAWCTHLETFHEVFNRLERGRTYARNGSIIDLVITPGFVAAIVAGSSIYKVYMSLKPLDEEKWQQIVKKCSGEIGSMLELLSGKFSAEVMSHISNPKAGLFPAHNEISIECSCPDWTTVCKHVAAVLYAIGARLDEQPELLFTLRQVDPKDLISAAANGDDFLNTDKITDEKQLLTDQNDSDLSELFGIELSDTKSKPKQKSAAKVKSKNSAQKKTKTAKASEKTLSLITSKELISMGFSRYEINKLFQKKLINRKRHGVYETAYTKDELRNL